VRNTLSEVERTSRGKLRKLESQKNSLGTSQYMKSLTLTGNTVLNDTVADVVEERW